MKVVTGITCSNCGCARPETPGACANCGDSRRTFAAEVHCQVGVVATINSATTRGPESWMYFNMVAGLLLTIVLAAIAVLDEIPGWARAIAIVGFAALILVAVADNGTVHSLLLRFKRSYEDKAR